MPRTVRCPEPGVSLETLREFALTYHAYRRLAGSPDHLRPLVQPVLDALEAGDPVPEWAGTDLLRATMFFVQRWARATEHDAPPAAEELHYRALTARIREQVGRTRLSADEFG